MQCHLRTQSHKTCFFWKEEGTLKHVKTLYEEEIKTEDIWNGSVHAYNNDAARTRGHHG